MRRRRSSHRTSKDAGKEVVAVEPLDGDARTFGCTRTPARGQGGRRKHHSEVQKEAAEGGGREKKAAGSPSPAGGRWCGG